MKALSPERTVWNIKRRDESYIYPAYSSYLLSLLGARFALYYFHGLMLMMAYFVFVIDFINSFRENLSWNLSLNCITPGIMCSLPLPVAWGQYQPQNKLSFWGFQENHLFEFNLQIYLISSAYKISAKTSCWLLCFFFCFSNSLFQWEYRYLGTQIYAGASQ